MYKKAELKSFLQFHRMAEEPLRDDELAILNGVLELNNKDVEMIMTPLRVNLGLQCLPGRNVTNSFIHIGRRHFERR